jgi:hypothetical protein
MQTRLVAGRDFDERDRAESTPVAIVNQALAHRLFPDENALGKRLRRGPTSSKWIQIVGIAQDGKYQSLNDESEPAIFWPRSQAYSSFTTIVARSALPPEDVVRTLQQIVLSLDPTLPFFQAGSLEEHLNLPLMPARIAAIMLGAFGALAVILAATGVYGMLAYAISRRTREIGIRVAIGASKTNVLSLVLRRALMIIGAERGWCSAGAGRWKILRPRALRRQPEGSGNLLTRTRANGRDWSHCLLRTGPPRSSHRSGRGPARGVSFIRSCHPSFSQSYARTLQLRDCE